MRVSLSRDEIYICLSSTVGLTSLESACAAIVPKPLGIRRLRSRQSIVKGDLDGLTQTSPSTSSSREQARLVKSEIHRTVVVMKTKATLWSGPMTPGGRVLEQAVDFSARYRMDYFYAVFLSSDRVRGKKKSACVL